MIASKVELTTCAFKPSTAAIALTMSGSIPITVWPSGAMNSFGAYCASLATIRVPLDLTLAGTCAAMAALAALGGASVAVAVVLFLLLPQPASSAIASADAPTLRISLLIGNLLPQIEDCRRPRAAQVYGGERAQCRFTESPKDLPALRTALRRKSYCACTRRSAISRAESTISCRLGAVLPRIGSARSTVSTNLRTASTVARWPSSIDLAKSRGSAVALPRAPLARDAPPAGRAAEAFAFAVASVPAFRWVAVVACG